MVGAATFKALVIAAVVTAILMPLEMVVMMLVAADRYSFLATGSFIITIALQVLGGFTGAVLVAAAVTLPVGSMFEFMARRMRWESLASHALAGVVVGLFLELAFTLAGLRRIEFPELFPIGYDPNYMLLDCNILVGGPFAASLFWLAKNHFGRRLRPLRMASG